MAVPVEFWYFIGSGLVLMWIVIMFINFLLGGLLAPFFKVKVSRGKKVLVIVRNQIQDYFRPGEIIEGFLVFEDRQKETRRIPMIPGVVSRAATIFWVTVDDEKNTFIKRDTGEMVSGFDAVKYDELYKRALYKPLTMGDNLLKVVILLLILVLIAVVVVGFMNFKNYQVTQQILGIVQSAGTAVKNGAGVVV